MVSVSAGEGGVQVLGLGFQLLREGEEGVGEGFLGEAICVVEGLGGAWGEGLGLRGLGWWGRLVVVVVVVVGVEE